jgi:hypothetical protein
MTAAVAAAAMIRKEKLLVEHFRAQRASSPDQARTTAELGVEPHSAWHRLVRAAVIREAADGRFYLDEPSWTARLSVRRRIGLVLLGIVVVVGATLWFATNMAR